MSPAISAPILLEGWCQDAPGIAVRGLGIEPGAIQPGHAFIAMNEKGVAQASEAEARGAALVVHDGSIELPSLNIPAITVPGLAQRISSLASRFYRYPGEQLSLVGVSGSHGKSTVAHYLAQSWQRVNGSAGLVGVEGSGPFGSIEDSAAHENNPIRLQRALFDCVDHGIETVALEATAEMLQAGYLDQLAFDVAVFTSLENDHSKAFATHEELEQATQRLFVDCLPRFAVVNHDQAAGKTLSRLVHAGTQVLTYGTHGSTELHGSVLGMDATGMRIAISSPWGGGEIRTGLLGAYNLSYLLATAGSLALMGMPWNRVMHQLEIMRAEPGRMNGIGGEGGQPVAVIDRAQTPLALEKTLRSLRAHLHGRLTCVIGGGFGRQAMAQVAETLADRIVLTSDSGQGECPSAVFNDMLGAMNQPGLASVISNRSEAIHQAIGECSDGDIVLIAGMGGDAAHSDLSDESTVRQLLEEAA